MTVILNKNSFWLHSQLTAFCIKNNPRENRFFAASGRLADGKGTNNVKIFTENYAKKDCIANTHVGNGTESTCAYGHLRERLHGMLPTTHGDRIMVTQNQPAVGRQF